MHQRSLSAATLIAVLLILTISPTVGVAQTSKFNYQGKLIEGSMVASGTYSMKFSLYDADTAGNQIGSTITESSVSVINGVFSVALDFGSTPFTGSGRYLEIQVKKSSDSGYTTLSPRQQILASPYSIKTLSASSADSLSSSCSGCVTNSHIADVAGSKVSGTVANATNATSATTATTAGTISSTLPINKGGTGSTTQNFVDLSTNQTVAGNKEFTGTTKFTGEVQFAGKINTFKAISGTIGSILFSPSGYTFVGGTNTITLTGTQTVAGSATASLGTTFPLIPFKAGICYQDTSGGAVSTLAGSQTVSLATRFQFQAITLTATNSTLPAGTYTVGFCIGDTSFPIDYNDVVSGWVMVFEN